MWGGGPACLALRGALGALLASCSSRIITTPMQAFNSFNHPHAAQHLDGVGSNSKGPFRVHASATTPPPQQQQPASSQGQANGTSAAPPPAVNGTGGSGAAAAGPAAAGVPGPHQHQPGHRVSCGSASGGAIAAGAGGPAGFDRWLRALLFQLLLDICEVGRRPVGGPGVVLGVEMV